MTMDARRRNQLLAAGALAAAFLAGGVGGAAATAAIDWWRAPRAEEGLVHTEIQLPRMPAPPGEGGVFWRRSEGQELADRLGLTEAQRNEVQRLMEEQQVKAERLMNEMEPRLKALMDSTHARIEAVLTPEQRERYGEMREMRRDFLIRRLEPPPLPPEPGIRRSPETNEGGER